MTEFRAPCRVGILYRNECIIESVFIPSQGSVHVEGDIGRQIDIWWTDPYSVEEWKEIRQWMEEEGKGCLDRDRSYLEYFYRCLEEGSVYYYLYEHGVGWSCGDVTGKSPISSKLLKLSDAISEMEEWAISLKYPESSSIS